MLRGIQRPEEQWQHPFHDAPLRGAGQGSRRQLSLGAFSLTFAAGTWHWLQFLSKLTIAQTHFTGAEGAAGPTSPLYKSWYVPP